MPQHRYRLAEMTTLAELVASQLAGRAVVGPSLGIGVSPHHLAFAGTVSLSTGTPAAVVRDYVDSLHRHGWRDILVITGHGGNNATLTTVAQMLVDVPAETTQALFRIADSGSTAITPMSPYFVMALGFLQRYRKSAGLGTLASYTLPLAVAMTVAWTPLFLAWWALGIPLGPGASVR